MATVQMLRAAHRLNTVRGRFSGRLARALPSFFERQSGRVVERWLNHMDPTGGHAKALSDNMLPTDEDELLWELMISIEISTMLSIGNIAADMVGASPFLTRTDPRLLQLLRQSGKRIVGINDTTRRAVQDTILAGYDHGYNDYQIAHGVAADGFRGLDSVVRETYQGRAEAVAITEIGTASNLAAADRYDSSGIQFAELLDGAGCHLYTHDDGPVANGLVLPLHTAMQYPLSHTRCRRVITPWSPALGAAVPMREQVPAIVRAA